MSRRLFERLRRQGNFAWTFLWVSGARVTMLVCSLLGTVLIYRALTERFPGMVEAGHFAVAMAAVRILTNCIGGTADLVVMRRVPVLITTDRSAAGDVVRVAFLLRFATLLFVSMLALPLAGVLAREFLDTEDEAPLVLLIVLAAGGELLLRCLLSLFQVTERFDRFVTYEACFQALRLAGVAVLYGGGMLSVAGVLTTYAAAGLGVALLAWRQVPGGLLIWRAVPAGLLRDGARFFLWTITAFFIAATTERLDLFLLSRLRGLDEAGIYGGVLALAVIPDYVGGLLATVLQPRVARLAGTGALPQFRRRLTLVMLPLAALGMLAAWLLAEPVLGLVLGPAFVPAAPAFVILLGAATVWLVLTPVPAVLISLRLPWVTTAMSLVQLVVMAGGGALLIPTYGVTGAAVTVACSRCIVAVAIVVMGQRLVWQPVAR